MRRVLGMSRAGAAFRVGRHVVVCYSAHHAVRDGHETDVRDGCKAAAGALVDCPRHSRMAKAPACGAMAKVYLHPQTVTDILALRGKRIWPSASSRRAVSTSSA